MVWSQSDTCFGRSCNHGIFRLLRRNSHKLQRLLFENASGRNGATLRYSIGGWSCSQSIFGVLCQSTGINSNKNAITETQLLWWDLILCWQLTQRPWFNFVTVFLVLQMSGKHWKVLLKRKEYSDFGVALAPVYFGTCHFLEFTGWSTSRWRHITMSKFPHFGSVFLAELCQEV